MVQAVDVKRDVGAGADEDGSGAIATATGGEDGVGEYDAGVVV